MKQKSYIIFGCSGSGKSTFANYLKNNMKYYHVTTGELVRAEINNKTPRGQYFAEMIKKDDLIPDELFQEVLRDNLLSLISGSEPFVFEGCPQTYGQSTYLLSMLQEVPKSQQIILIYFIIDPDLALKRISSRLICKNCRTIFNKEYHTGIICSECQGILAKSFLDRKENGKKRLATFQKNMENVSELFSKHLNEDFIQFKSDKNYNPTAGDYLSYIGQLI